MSVKVLKRASKTPSTGEDDTNRIVRTMLHEIEQKGEDRIREYARQLDGWDREIIVDREQIDAADLST